MKITLPIKGYYKIFGDPRGSYNATLGIENLSFAYGGDTLQMGLGFGADSIHAEFVPGSIIRPLSVGHALSSADAQLTVSSDTEILRVGIGMSATPLFIRSAENSEFGVGFGVSEAAAALVRKTTLGDFDSLTLGEMDNQVLYDLAYITIE